MKNDKTVDPRDKKSTKVIQLETAMGAAISCFEGCSNNSKTVEDAEDKSCKRYMYIIYICSDVNLLTLNSHVAQFVEVSSI